MRIATYNVEWFSSLFDDENRLLLDHSWSGRRDVTRLQQIEALSRVFRALDADAVMIVEAPDTTDSKDTRASLLEFFRYAGLKFDRVVHGFANDTQQEIAFAYDSAVMAARHDPIGNLDEAEPAPRFDGRFRMDVDVDGAPEMHVFSKPPLEVAVEIEGHDLALRLIGVHVKSKAPHGARNRHEEVRISISNRRRQLAQCQWLRRRVVEHLDAGDNLIVLGDFNDGPGLDQYEELFGRSGVEIVLGTKDTENRRLFDPHAAARLDPRNHWSPSSARFYLHRRKTYLNALLDYIMVNQGLRQRLTPRWKIWHPFDDPECWGDGGLQKDLLTASDHFPVTMDIDLPRA